MLTIKIYDRLHSVHSHSIRILYNLGAPIKANQSTLQRFDFLLANPQEQLIMKDSPEKVSYALFSIDTKQFQLTFDNQQLLFEADSSASKNDNHDVIKKKLSKLLLSWSDKSLLAKAEFQRHSYDLFLLLVKHYRVSPWELQEKSQADLYRDYVEQHFQTELSLSEISSAFYMTPQYFSKHFKEQVGENFYKYLTKTRLQYASHLLENSSKNILKIALDSGFSTPTAFNRAFKELNGRSPAEYRKSIVESQASSLEFTYQEMIDILQLVQEEKDSQQEVSITVQTNVGEIIEPFWKKVINIGHGASFRLQEVREQFLRFQKELAFEYVRLILPYPKDYHKDYLFYREECELDFFVELEMKLQLVIDYKALEAEPDYLPYLNRLLSHFSNRYSIGRVREWRVELDYPNLFNAETCLAYGQAYQDLQSILDRFGLQKGLFGPGFILGDVESFKCFIERMRLGQIPYIQHLTFHVQPDIKKVSVDKVIWKTVTDQNYISNQLEMVNQYLQSEDHDIHIVEWKDFSCEKSWLHDSTYKAASMVKTTLSCFGKLSDIAWNIPLDLILNQDSGDLLSGLEGCITVHGICKPTYYAHRFMNHHGSRILFSDLSTLITAHGHNITIINHNCSQLSVRYHLEGEEAQFSSGVDYFESERSTSLRYQLTGMKPGNYLIKMRRIFSDSGSLRELSQQVFLNGVTTIGRSEIEFLRNMSIPQLSLENQYVDGDFELSMLLEANEICHTHIIYLY